MVPVMDISVEARQAEASVTNEGGVDGSCPWVYLGERKVMVEVPCSTAGVLALHLVKVVVLSDPWVVRTLVGEGRTAEVLVTFPDDVLLRHLRRWAQTVPGALDLR